MSRHRHLRIVGSLAPCLITIALCLALNSRALADDSTCITCHTDEELLADNLAEPGSKKSALQSGSG